MKKQICTLYIYIYSYSIILRSHSILFLILFLRGGNDKLLHTTISPTGSLHIFLTMKLLSLLVLAFALLLSYNVAATTPALSTTLSLWDSFMSIISMIVPGIVPTPATSDVPIDFGSPIIQKNLDDEKDSDSAVGPLLDEAKKLIQTGTMDQTVVGILLNALEVNPDHQEAVWFINNILV